MRYLDRSRAAQYLTSLVNGFEITPQALANRAHDRTGPPYSIINGRAVYTVADLDAWITAQSERPLRRRVVALATCDSAANVAQIERAPITSDPSMTSTPTGVGTRRRNPDP